MYLMLSLCGLFALSFHVIYIIYYIIVIIIHFPLCDLV